MAASSNTAWQRRLLPLMSVVLVCAAIFFAVQSIWEFADFKARINAPKIDLGAMFAQSEHIENTSAAPEAIRYLQWKSLILLEEEALQHRYAQANATILARSWTRLMGFTTGMVLAVVGAAFVLGKLQEEQTEIKQESEFIKLSLATSSPGIILAFLGSVLMGIALLTRFDVEIHDAPVYLGLRSNRLSTEIPDPRSLVAPSGKDNATPNSNVVAPDPRLGGSP